jgi:hypothetical protein
MFQILIFSPRKQKTVFRAPIKTDAFVDERKNASRPQDRETSWKQKCIFNSIVQKVEIQIHRFGKGTLLHIL